MPRSLVLQLGFVIVGLIDTNDAAACSRNMIEGGFGVLDLDAHALPMGVKLLGFVAATLLIVAAPSPALSPRTSATILSRSER